MGDLLAVATIPSDTGLAADAVSNSFAIQIVGDHGVGEPLLIAEAVIDFYNAVPTGVDRIGSNFNLPLSDWLSPILSTSPLACSVDIYDLAGHEDGSNHGSPIFSLPFTLDAPPAGNTPIPSEVACVGTLEALGRAAAAVNVPAGVPGPEGDTHPKARHSGRVFIGPLNNTAVVVLDGRAMPHTVLQDTILQGLLNLNDAVGFLNGTTNLGVWSRSDAMIRQIEAVSVDNAFDTQRRRGERATLRRRVVA